MANGPTITVGEKIRARARSFVSVPEGLFSKIHMSVCPAYTSGCENPRSSADQKEDHGGISGRARPASYRRAVEKRRMKTGKNKLAERKDTGEVQTLNDGANFYK